jgi:hypothetical protein
VTYFDLGKVDSGYLPGAIFIEVTRSPNPDPDKCFSDTGITKLVTDVSVINIKNGHEMITCWGKYVDLYQPGVKNTLAE